MKFAVILALLPVAIFAAPGSILPPLLPSLRPSLLSSPIPGRYIVKFRSLKTINFQSVLSLALGMLQKDPTYVYKFGDFGGFAAEMSDTMVKIIRTIPGVAYVEQDLLFRASLGEVHHVQKRAYVTQSPSSSTWGQSRICQIRPAVPGYTYDDSAGAGTCTYVLDTGIDVSHPDFEGRATFLVNFSGDGQNTDGNGHGTHVAGTVGSKTYGVAKKTKLYAIKVLKSDGTGASSGIIAGLNFVVNDAKTRTCSGGTVINLSLGGTQSSAVNSAAANAVAEGHFMVVAAGNSDQDASTSSPASEASVFTVGATDSADYFASFSNYGSFVDISAPGVSIVSTWLNWNAATVSGTSMATPHVAGLAAYILALEGRRTPAALSNRLQVLATKNRIRSLPAGTPNYLAFNGNPSASK